MNNSVNIHTNKKKLSMNKSIVLILSLGLILLSSCEKEVTPVNPTNTTPPAVRNISVDYSISAVSGDMKIVALVPDANGVLVETTLNINRQSHTIHFETKSQQELILKAINTNPSHDEVMVTIYVDGNIFRSNSTTAANGWAVAKGIPQ